MKYVILASHKLQEILARNVWFTPDAELHLLELLKAVKNEKVKKWIKSNLRNYLTNDIKLNKITRNIKLPSNAPDWINEKRDKEAIYILTQDNLKKRTFPLRDIVEYLDKELSTTVNVSNMSVPDVLTKYTEWKRGSNKSGTAGSNGKKAATTGIKLIEKLPNGYSWYQVTGRQALINEGKMMQHCLQKDGYYNDVKAGRIQIFSLRGTNNNESHVTIEYDKRYNEIKQIKGKQNSVPAVKYHQMVLDFINKNNYGVGGSCFDFNNLSPIKLTNGQFIILPNYKGKLAVEEGGGPLSINKKTIQRDTCDFPEIHGYYVAIRDLNISTDTIEANNLVIEDCVANKLSASVEDTFDIRNSNIKELTISNTPFKLEIYSSNIAITAKELNRVTVSCGFEENKVKFSNGIKIDHLIVDGDSENSEIVIGNDATIEYLDIKQASSVKITLGKNIKINELKEPDSLTTLPNELQILGDLTIDGNKLPELIGSNVRVNGTLLVLHSDIIPKDIMNKIKSIKCTKLVMEK